MNKTIKFLVSRNISDERLDIFLSKKIENFTRSHIKKLIQQNEVRINNNVINSPSKKLKYKDKISINLVKKTDVKLKPKKIKLDIIFEDEDLIILNKKKGMVVHPGAGNYENTLANALAHRYNKALSNINGELRPGIVHRIDKDTSGLLVVVKIIFLTLNRKTV